ncbi:MAG: DNA internalization-related competence protein ComEC/Rec2 [Dehalococcoidales bacterium]|nr:DNA internalization-related competence protein ComEC/Rec2 [Dehalococcoidales bacterium]
MPLIFLSCCWVIGIFLGVSFPLPSTAILSGLAPLPMLFFMRHNRKRIILASLMLFAIAGGAIHSYTSQNTINEQQLRYYNDRGVTEIIGTVAADPEVRDKVTHLRLSAREIKIKGSWQPVLGTVLVFVPNYPAYRYGDLLEINGKLATPTALDDFDYRGYLAHQGIYSTITYPETSLVAGNEGNKPLDWLYSLRRQMALTLSRVLPEPQASLAQAIVLGTRETMPQSLKDNFARTGTTHLLAISGLNLTIIAGMLVGIGIRIFGKRHYLYVWLALGVIWLYALLTALNPPVVRGAIMASLFLIAEALGRQRNVLPALCLAAALMTIPSPHILGDASFQLSFLAMAGLVLIAPALQNWGRSAVKSIIGEEGALDSFAVLTTDSLSISLAAIIAVWPVVAYYFGIFSPAGPLATLLALPVMPAIITAGALTALTGLLMPLAQLLGWLTWLFLSYLLLVVNLLAELPFAATSADFASPVFIAGYYTVLAGLLWAGSNWRRFKADIKSVQSGIGASADFLSHLSVKWVLMPLVIIAILVTATAATMPDDKLRVSFLNVGEGDAIFIQKGSSQILIDGGSGSQALNLALGDKMPFWDRTLDLLILTHPHTDHLAGLVAALHRFSVNQLLYPDLIYESPVYAEWRQLIADKAIKSTGAQAGQQIDLSGGATLEVLHPVKPLLAGTESDIDNNSMVLRLSYGEVSFLLAADIMSDAERELILRRAPLASTVLKVPHHGSATSSTAEFLAVVDPQIAIISVGEDNKFGHPDDEVLQRLETIVGAQNVYRTDSRGTVEFITDGARLWVK